MRRGSAGMMVLRTPMSTCDKKGGGSIVRDRVRVAVRGCGTGFGFRLGFEFELGVDRIRHRDRVCRVCRVNRLGYPPSACQSPA